jgi:hypothetical protein
MMRTNLLIGLAAASLSLGACASDRYYGYDDPYYGDRYGDGGSAGERAVAGAAIGGAVGAGVGAVVGGVSPVEGAVAGALIGGVAGAATADKDRRWYRDTRGYCFYVNQYGDRVYDYNIRC